MTKSNFFKLLNELAEHYEAKADSFELATLVESKERQQHLLSIAGRREWSFNLISVRVNDCWNINVRDHNTVEAMEKNLPTYTRWLNEWKEAKRIDEAHEEALIINAAITQATEVVFCTVEGTRLNAVHHAVNTVRDNLSNVVPVRLVVMAMSIVSRAAHKKADEYISQYKRILDEAAATPHEQCEIPF